MRSGVAVTALLLAATTARAQTREPVAGFVADLRLVTATLPSSQGWTPTLATGAIVPGRGYGVDAGAHVIVGPGRHKRLGIGASGLFAQGRATGTAGGTVTTRLTTILPHVSANFGHRSGWSYLSGGVGVARLTSEEVGGAADPSGWSTAFHYGMGGRWFLNDRVAVALELRFLALAPRKGSGDRPNAPATTRIVLGAGVSLR